jgi:nitroimidazol reductase NimA-like FMN-containing flavoprotein (pyridoxamine 5'-phosphate oxidase superfamily)
MGEWTTMERVEKLDEHRCLEYLHSQTLGRLAFQLGGDVEIFPVNYGCDGRIVIFRTASGTRLELAPQGRVSFEVDSWDPQTGLGWSVVMKGIAHEVTQGTDPFSKALRARNVQPLAPGTRDRWIAVYPSEISGRRFRLGA